MSAAFRPRNFVPLARQTPFVLYWRKPQLFVAHSAASGGVLAELIIVGFPTNLKVLSSYFYRSTIRSGTINWTYDLKTCAFRWSNIKMSTFTLWNITQKLIEKFFVIFSHIVFFIYIVYVLYIVYDKRTSMINKFLIALQKN